MRQVFRAGGLLVVSSLLACIEAPPEAIDSPPNNQNNSSPVETNNTSGEPNNTPTTNNAPDTNNSTSQTNNATNQTNNTTSATNNSAGPYTFEVKLEGVMQELANVPIYITLPNLPRALTGPVAVVSTELQGPFAQVSAQSSNQLSFWVNWPQVLNTATSHVFEIRNSAAPLERNPPEVWQDFQAVWHFGTLDTLSDSSNSNSNLVVEGCSDPTCIRNETFIDGALGLTGRRVVSDGKIVLGDEWTMMFWFKAVTNNKAVLSLRQGNDQVTFYLDQSTLVARTRGAVVSADESLGFISLTEWNHVLVRVVDGSLVVYLNGGPGVSPSEDPLVQGEAQLVLGDNSSQAEFDEIWIGNIPEDVANFAYKSQSGAIPHLVRFLQD